MPLRCRNAARRLVTLAALAALMGASGCTGGTSPDAHFRTVYTRLTKGELAAAYGGFLPASYQGDLDRLLEKSKRLIEQDEFERLQGILQRAGVPVASVAEARAESDPRMKALARFFRDPLSSIGLASYEDLQRVNVSGLLEKLEQSPLGELFRDPSLREQIGTVEFTVVERSGDRARLRVKKSGGPGPDKQDETPVRLVEGRWVPAEMASDWPSVMARLDVELDKQLALKEKDPEAFDRHLDALETQVQQLAMWVPLILQGLEQGKREG